MLTDDPAIASPTQTGPDVRSLGHPVWHVLLVMGMYALAIGCRNPLFALTLSDRGTPAWLIGFTGVGQALAMIVMPVCFGAVFGRIGYRNAMALAAVLESAIVAALLFSTSLLAWAALRALLGLCQAVMLAGGQVWLNAEIADARRSTFVGIYTAVLGVGLATGALLPGLVPAASPVPFIAITGLCALAGVFARSGRPEPIAPGRGGATDFRQLFKVAPLVGLSFFVIGFKDTSLGSFLPLFGVLNGLSRLDASLLLSAAMVGGMTIPFLNGIFTSRIPEPQLGLALAAAVCGAGLLLAGMAMFPLTLRLAAAYVAGGAGALMFSRSVAELGSRLGGGQLSGLTAACGGCWGAGSLVAFGASSASLNVYAGMGYVFLFFMVHLLFSILCLRYKR